MKNNPKNTRYNAPIRIMKSIIKTFKKRRKTIGKAPDSPCVYLARHLDTTGVIRAFCEIDDELTPWVLSVFFDKNQAREHFYNYTFCKKKSHCKPFRFFASNICARFVCYCVKSTCAIPVYRNEQSSKSITTIKQSVNALLQGKKLIIFVDKDYASKGDTDQEIYQGFVAVAQLYKRKTGKDLAFVPISFLQTRTVICPPVYLMQPERDCTQLAKKSSIGQAETSAEFFASIKSSIFATE